MNVILCVCHVEMVQVFFIANGFAKNYLEEIKKAIQKQLLVTEAKDEHSCDVIVAVCTIVSRVGTDIEAALREIPPRTLICMMNDEPTRR